MTSHNDREPHGCDGTGPHAAKSTWARCPGVWVVGGSLALAIVLVVARLLDRSRPPDEPGQQVALSLGPSEDVRLPPLPPDCLAKPASRDSVKGPPSDLPALPALSLGAGSTGTQTEPPIPTTIEAATEGMRQVAQRALADFPNQPDALEMSACLSLTLGHSDKADEWLQRARTLNPAKGQRPSAPAAPLEK
jgi:hypothetical protein